MTTHNRLGAFTGGCAKGGNHFLLVLKTDLKGVRPISSD
jgi:hypothetical protein